MSDRDQSAFPALRQDLSGGMSLRDYFAAHVLSEIYREADIDSDLIEIASFAYDVADAMIEARKR